MRRTVAIGLAAACAGLLWTQQAETYYDDAHYSLTYYMARACGYTPLQAFRMASANVSVDYSPDTEPVQMARTARPAGAAVRAGAAAAGTEFSAGNVSTNAHEPRVRFHAFRDDRGPRDAKAADAAIEAQREHLWRLGVMDRNPGVFLHFLQDEPSHAGFSSMGGHWIPGGALADASIPAGAYGSRTDYMANSANNTFVMVVSTLGAITKFMGEMSPTQRLRACDPARMTSVLDGLAKANTVPLLQATQYASQLPLSPVQGTPDVAKANPVIRSALTAAREFAPYPDQPKRYTYDVGGRLARATDAELDAFSLYGALGVRVDGAPAGAPVEVSIWAAETRPDEPAYQLACASISAPTLFENLPAGNLFVQTVTRGGRVIRQPLLLNTRRQNLALDLAQTPPGAKDCGAPVSALSGQLCALTSGGTPRADVARIEALEARVRAQLADAAVCRGAETTSASAASPEVTGGRCISTRSCVVNIMRGTCSCAGTPNGPCDYAGTPALSGARCDAGVPCAAGLSCNNGRCEDKAGRCPF